jgi:reactive intermediate/imine deaminase
LIEGWTFGPDEGVPPPVAPFAHATAAGDTLYVTGQMPTGLDGRLVDGGVEAQTDQAMRNLAAVLSRVGGLLSDVVMVRAYLMRWADYPAFNAAYVPWFAERLPSRTCVGVSGLAAGALVEIDLVAWRAGGWPAPEVLA